MKHFRKLGALDPAPVLDAISNLAEPFAVGEWRRSMRRSPHGDSDTLEIIGPPTHSPRDVIESQECVPSGYWEVPAFKAAVLKVAQLAGKDPARAMIVALKPGGTVHSHRDEGAYADATERYHFVLATNPAAMMVATPESAFFGTGEVWWLDKHVLHCAANLGSEPRLHMIVDTWGPA